MKTTIYELLGMVKDGKPPKKIKYENYEYYLDNNYYISTDKTRLFDYIYFSDLNTEVEILEEPKGIPEKINNGYYHLEQGEQNQLFKNKINEIIDYLEYLESKGE